MQQESRYGSLRTIARIFRVLAWITIIFGGLGVLGATVSGAAQGASGEALVMLIGGGLFVAFYALMFFAMAEFIHLMVDVEANTRRTAEALATAPRPPSP
ncbi:MAG TPA: hypothetical protein VM573_02450 [Actinomycetota bacterium]|jgi:uncharacterized membrane protein|nr:hypothetical protein [Actinomycetota bacterium]